MHSINLSTLSKNFEPVEMATVSKDYGRYRIMAESYDNSKVCYFGNGYCWLIYSVVCTSGDIEKVIGSVHNHGRYKWLGIYVLDYNCRMLEVLEPYFLTHWLIDEHEKRLAKAFEDALGEQHQPATDGEGLV